MKTFVKKSLIPVNSKTVFAWHESPNAFQMLIPPWEKVKVKSQTGPISAFGSRVILEIKVFGPISIDWIAEHYDYVQGVEFQDIQIKGPFKYWRHYHRVLPIDNQSCYLEDRIDYELPFSPLSHWLVGFIVQRKLERMFDYRHKQMLAHFIKD